jgi:hypothetical protein
MASVPPNESLLRALRRGTATAAELEQELSRSRRWLWTHLPQQVAAGLIVKMGAKRDARYGLRREIEGIGSAWPLRRIGRAGLIEDLGTLYALLADQYYVEPRPEAVKRGFKSPALHAGLPYFLQDQRPGGFLGRAVPLRYPELNLPQRVTDWTDDHYLRYLTIHGSDTVGDLILGAPAFDEFVARQRQLHAIESSQRELLYPGFAKQVMEGGLPGSSAHGEHPKFTAFLDDSGNLHHVLVKFSPPRGEAIGQRWADLLIAEHHGHELLRTAGLPTAQSRILMIEDRLYLEVIRFDRAGQQGRVGVTSLLSIDTSFYGKLDNWIAAANRLREDRRIDARTLEQVRLAYTFAGLIANTDRHFGNLAFFDAYDGRFQLAPIYDMLPMLFAPEHNQIAARTFEPPDPVSDTLGVWGHARALAERYWRQLVADERISDDFKENCAKCLAALESLPRTGPYAPSQSQYS